MSPKQNGAHKRNRYIKILMDSGASASIIHESYVSQNSFTTRKTSTNQWSTITGSFSTSSETKITLQIPELNVAVHISAPFHVTTKKSNYDVIFGRDLLQELGIQLDFQHNSIGWQYINLPMKAIDCKMRTHFTIQDSNNVGNATKRIKKILDNNYKKANLKNTFKS